MFFEVVGMCGACGAISGGPDWIDRVGNPEGISHQPELTRAAERQRRIAIVNLVLRPYRLQLSDTGASLALRGPTGRTELVESLAHVWTAADRISSAVIDPLDERLLETLGS
jgi:hypothetical protein